MIDSGLIDNGPVVPGISFISEMQTCEIPTHMHVASSTSGFGLFNFYMGQDKLDVWSGAGLNLCPFRDVSYCGAVTQLRELVKRMVPEDVLQKYTELSTAYAVWLPQNQILVSFCGDPIAFDNFKGMCRAKSYCFMATTVIPSLKMRISFTVQIISVIFSVLYLAPTALAKNFVHDYLPQRIYTLPSLQHIAVWFPAFSTMGEEKGGFPFFKPHGHALLDYMTFAVVRLTPEVVRAKLAALPLTRGDSPDCEYANYLSLSDVSIDESKFRMSQFEQ